MGWAHDTRRPGADATSFEVGARQAESRRVRWTRMSLERREPDRSGPAGPGVGWHVSFGRCQRTPLTGAPPGDDARGAVPPVQRAVFGGVLGFGDGRAAAAVGGGVADGELEERR